MIVNSICEKLNLKIFNLSDGQLDVRCGYTGDLLSWVMGNAPEESAWITIMSNKNLIAVAEMTGASCIVLSEGVSPDDDMLSKAVTEGVNVLGSELGSFELSAKIYELINNG